MHEALVYNGAGQVDTNFVGPLQLQAALGETRKPSLIALYDSAVSGEIRETIRLARNIFPGAVLQIGLFLPSMPGLIKVASGEFDRAIARQAAWYKAMATPIFLRIGYECDLESNGYAPREYIGAFRRVVDVFRGEGCQNVSPVWCVTKMPMARETLNMWYPGDEWVDWCAYDAFTPCFDDEVFLAFAREHGKQVLLGECSTGETSPPAASREAWENWFVPFFRKLGTGEIRGFQYINWDWSRTPWGWADGRLHDAGPNMDRYREALGHPRFIHRDESYFDPVRLAVACGQRGKTGQAWSPESDEALVRGGYGYAPESGTIWRDGYWQHGWYAGDGLALRLRLPAGEEGILRLHLVSPAGDTPFRLRLNGGEKGIFTGTYSVGNHPGREGAIITIPIASADTRDGELCLELIASDRRGVLAGFLFCAVDPRWRGVMPAPSIDRREGQFTLRWTPVPGAEGYNIYHRGRLVCLVTAETTHYKPDVGTPPDGYRVSAWNTKYGETRLAAAI